MENPQTGGLGADTQTQIMTHNVRIGTSRIFSLAKGGEAATGVIALGGAIFGGSLLFLLLLIVTGQFAAISTVWPASNVTKITTNIANSVVVGSNFLTLIILGAAVGIIILVFGLALRGLGRMRGG